MDIIFFSKLHRIETLIYSECVKVEFEKSERRTSDYRMTTSSSSPSFIGVGVCLVVLGVAVHSVPVQVCV